jgi:hypothetical protein
MGPGRSFEEEQLSYVVNWQRSDGGESWHTVSELHEAANFAEHLRNAEGVETAKIFRLDEVAFAFKPYFRVELDAVAPPAPPAPAPAAPVEAEPVEAATEVRTPAWTASPAAPPEDVEVNGSRRGLFGR